MNALVDEAVEFFTESGFWRENRALMADPDVVFHEARFDTALDPVALEYLFREMLRRQGIDVRSVGHAVFGDRAWIKLYPIELPIFNAVWHHAPGAVLVPHESEPFETWRYSDEQAFVAKYRPRLPGPDDIEVVRAYLKSDHWCDQMLAKIADPEVEHFHLFLETELDSRSLDPYFKQALREAGVVSHVPTWPLANIGYDPPGLWLGHAPNGTTSWEIALCHTPGKILEPREMTQYDHSYGGDGWTVSDYKAQLARYDFEPLTLNEADAILDRIL